MTDFSNRYILSVLRFLKGRHIMNKQAQEFLADTYALMIGYDGYNDTESLKDLIDEVMARVWFVNSTMFAEVTDSYPNISDRELNELFMDLVDDGTIPEPNKGR